MDHCSCAAASNASMAKTAPVAVRRCTKSARICIVMGLSWTKCAPVAIALEEQAYLKSENDNPNTIGLPGKRGAASAINAVLGRVSHQSRQGVQFHAVTFANALSRA